TLELDQALVLERDLTAAVRELLDDCRREYLPCSGAFCYPRSDRDIASVEIVVLAHGIARVHADADANRSVGMVAELGLDRPLDRKPTKGRAAGARQGDHEAVTLYFDLEAAM